MTEPFPKWCPGCSQDVSASCHHFHCPVGPNRSDVGNMLVRLECQSPEGEWVEIFPSQLEWAAKKFPVRAIETHSPAGKEGDAEKLLTEVERRFPNWKSFRDLLDCIDCTLHVSAERRYTEAEVLTALKGAIDQIRALSATEQQP